MTAAYEPEFYDGRKVDPSEWGAPVPKCETCYFEHDEYGRIEGDGFLEDGTPCPDCDRGKDLADYPAPEATP